MILAIFFRVKIKQLNQSPSIQTGPSYSFTAPHASPFRGYLQLASRHCVTIHPKSFAHGSCFVVLCHVWEATEVLIASRFHGYPFACVAYFLGHWKPMMTSSNGNIFRVTGPLCGESISHRWIPLTKTSDAELWCLIWSASEQTVKQTIETQVTWNAIASIMTSL